MTSTDEAQAAIRRHDWISAESWLRDALSENGGSGETRYLLGWACFKQGKFAAAEEALLAALEQMPDDPPCLFYLAICATALGDPRQAATRLERYLARMPDDAEGWKHLGLALTATRAHGAALAAFDKAVALAPDAQEIRWLGGQARYQAGQYAAALELLATVDPHAPQADAACALAMQAAEKIGRYSDAVALAEQWLACAPEDGARLRQLYRMQFLAGQDEACLATHRRALAAQGEGGARHLVFARVVSTETWELLANNWVQLHLKSEPAGPSSRIRPSLTRHDRTRLLTPEWLVLTAANDVLVEQMTHNPLTLHTKGPHVPALTQERCLLELPETPAMVLDDACILVGGGPHYYHWLVDYLPRIGIAHKIPALRNLKLLVNANPAAWQWASLDALGIDRNLILEVPNNALVQCRALWVPTLLSRITATHTYVAGWLRRRLLTREMKSRPARRLYIRQPATEGSRLANEDGLIADLQEAGFEVLVPETLGFMEQVAAFAVAEVIVAPTVPALANLIFAPAGALVVEIQPPHNPATFFQALAQSVGLRYRRCVGQYRASASDAAGVGEFHLAADELLQSISSVSGVQA